MHTLSEENYLKAIYRLSGDDGKVTLTAIAEALANNPASVLDMLKRLAEKNLLKYDKKKGAQLTGKGMEVALSIVRKHRLWEVFLREKLEYTWDEVHDIAEQLEHIKHPELADRLDKFLGHPTFDPHGDPIPDKKGRIPDSSAILLADGSLKKKYRLVGVANHSSSFLQLLDKMKLAINDTITITEVQDFDKSMTAVVNGKHRVVLSAAVSRNLLVA